MQWRRGVAKVSVEFKEERNSGIMSESDEEGLKLIALLIAADYTCDRSL